MSTTKTREPSSACYHTVSQIADQWQCSERQVRRLIASGQLIAHRFGRLLRVSEADKRACERANRAD